MVFRYGAGESRFTETKIHVDEQQWSPVVFYDGPRCILCFRCVRACDEGMGVGALGVVNRGAVSLIAPNEGDHLNCDECGQCIDICPVGALTSGAYRYQTRPWEMEHVGTICTHCSNGCKTTLGVRNDHIIRGNNRDRSGINGEFLCIKGRYAFDFSDHDGRLQSPMIRVNGKLEPASWSKALSTIAGKFREIKERNGKFGIVGSNHTTNEENFYLQKFARQCLGTNNIDHHRTGDVVTLVDALSGTNGALATTQDLYDRKAFLIIGADLAHRTAVSCVPDSRQPTASRGARLRGHAERRSRGRSRREIDPHGHGNGTRSASPVARGSRGGTGTGDPLQRFGEGRRRPSVGQVRPIARHSGCQILPAGRLFELARRDRYGSCSRTASGLSGLRQARA